MGFVSFRAVVVISSNTLEESNGGNRPSLLAEIV